MKLPFTEAGRGRENLELRTRKSGFLWSLGVRAPGGRSRFCGGGACSGEAETEKEGAAPESTFPNAYRYRQEGALRCSHWRTG